MHRKCLGNVIMYSSLSLASRRKIARATGARSRNFFEYVSGRWSIWKRGGTNENSQYAKMCGVIFVCNFRTFVLSPLISIQVFHPITARYLLIRDKVMRRFTTLKLFSLKEQFLKIRYVWYYRINVDRHEIISKRNFVFTDSNCSLHVCSCKVKWNEITTSALTFEFYIRCNLAYINC